MENGFPSKQLTIGDRIGTVSHIDEKGVAHIFGYGVYNGVSQLGEEATGAFSAVARLEKRDVPTVVLDNGNVIWGTECHIERETVLKQTLDSDEVKGIEMMDILEYRAKAPKFLGVKFYIPPTRIIQCFPVQVSDDTYQRMEELRSLGRDLHLEGEFLRRPRQFTITISDNKEDLDIEIVESMGEAYHLAIDRLIERVHARLMVPSHFPCTQ